MLTFTLSIRLTGPVGAEVEEKDVEWNVGDASPTEYLDDAGLTVLSVMADGKELNYIIQWFNNLPYTMKQSRSCVWRGEMARFIFDNL